MPNIGRLVGFEVRAESYAGFTGFGRHSIDVVAGSSRVNYKGWSGYIRMNHRD